MDELIKYFSHSYYTEIISYLVALIAFVLFSLEKSNFKFFKFYFLVYLLISLLIYIVAYYQFDKTSTGKSVLIIRHHLDFFFTIFEYFVFANYLKAYVNKSVYKIARIIIILSSASIYIKIIKSETFINDKALFIFFTIQSIVLLLLCISYYIHMFVNQKNLVINNKSSFWITTGITFFLLCTLPFSLSASFLYDTDYILFQNLYSIYYIFYIILFIMIVIGLKCEKKNIVKVDFN